MTQTYLDKIKTELQKGIQETGHPFRIGVLATTNSANKPDIRSVVLRAVTEDLKLTFFTDARSAKVKHITNNNAVSILFYNSIEKLQIKVLGTANIVSNTQLLKATWASLPEYAHKDYTTTFAPGSTINNSEQISYLNKEHHFCMVDIQAHTIEYLQLDQTQHKKLKFKKKSGIWRAEFLVP